MKALRVLIALACFAAAGAAFYLKGDGVPEITVSEAVLRPMGSGHALIAKIDNPGRADRLLEVSTDDTGAAILGNGALAIPAFSAPSLAMDGVHAMIMGLGDLEHGRLVPVQLDFEQSGSIVTRARVDAGAMMDHTAPYEVPEGEPVPSISLTIVPNGYGWKITADTENFTFSKDAVDGPHQPGVGHGHLYLNGLKLQRLYTPEVTISRLPTGTHQLLVTLNTNDHRAYSVAGRPLTAIVEVTAD